MMTKLHNYNIHAECLDQSYAVSLVDISVSVDMYEFRRVDYINFLTGGGA